MEVNTYTVCKVKGQTPIYRFKLDYSWYREIIEFLISEDYGARPYLCGLDDGSVDVFNMSTPGWPVYCTRLARFEDCTKYDRSDYGFIKKNVVPAFELYVFDDDAGETIVNLVKASCEEVDYEES